MGVHKEAAMLKKLLIAAGIPLTLGLNAAVAQDQEEAAAPPQDKLIAEQSQDHVLSRYVLGMEVVGKDDTSLGTVDSLLFNDDDEIVGAVVSVGGFLGLGAKQVALSWDQFDIRASEGTARLDLTNEQLEAAPRFKDLETKKAEEAAARVEQRRQQQRQQQTPQ
jgi:hypothetical protein